MRILHTVLLTVVLVAAGGPAAVPGSSAHGQSATPRTRVAPRSFEVLSARGGEIGVTIRDLEAGDLKGAAGAERGVRVDAVAEDSPAAKAGIAKGDVLVEFDGEQVRSARQFARLVSETPPGRQVSVALLRDGRRMTVAVEPRAGSGLQLFDFPDLHGLENLNRDFALRLRPPVPPTPPAAPEIGRAHV